MEPSSLTGMVAVIEPSLTHARISLREAGAEVACLSSFGGVESLVPLLRLADASFDVDEWLVEVGGFQRVVMQSAAVMATAERLGIVLTPMVPRFAES